MSPPPPPPLDRRDFLKKSAMAAAAAALGACRDGFGEPRATAAGTATAGVGTSIPDDPDRGATATGTGPSTSTGTGTGSGTMPTPTSGTGGTPTQPAQPTQPTPVATTPAPVVVPADYDFPTGTALPFGHGVASGDPMPDRVILWTRLTFPTYPADAIAVAWTMGTRPDMSEVLFKGTQTTSADRDWTVKIDAQNLSPATTYYYRFTALGYTSITGRTRTAPALADATVKNVRFAVLSCASYWSSYWSGFTNMAARNDLDLIVHCGDYIYDFVDQDETVRARKDRKTTANIDYRDWRNLTEVRRRYALWHSDTNLLRAHQQHPFFIVWDNHDLDYSFGNELATSETGLPAQTCTVEDTTRAFWEWTPSRPVDAAGNFLLVKGDAYPTPPSPKTVWRKLTFGKLVDVFGIDTQIGLPYYKQPIDASHLPAGTPSLFGRQQFEWLTGNMLKSFNAGTTWRFVNNQTWIAPVDITGPLAAQGVNPQNLTRWDNYMVERAALFSYLRGTGLNTAKTRVRRNILVSGDMHGNWGADLTESPNAPTYKVGPPVASTRSGSFTENKAAGFRRASTANTAALNARADSVGVEFAPTSMGRGGADELVAHENPSNPTAANVAGARAIEQGIIAGNPACQFIEWVDHGYGIVDITPERTMFECWWQDKLNPNTPDVLGAQLVAWGADDTGAGTGVPPVPRRMDQIDAVETHNLTVTATKGLRTDVQAPAFTPVPN